MVGPNLDILHLKRRQQRDNQVHGGEFQAGNNVPGVWTTVYSRILRSCQMGKPVQKVWS